jgi:hypothetical protein
MTEYEQDRAEMDPAFIENMQIALASSQATSNSTINIGLVGL